MFAFSRAPSKLHRIIPQFLTDFLSDVTQKCGMFTVFLGGYLAIIVKNNYIDGSLSFLMVHPVRQR
jgi:hypothetical protein